jgi:hypothetical protein
MAHTYCANEFNSTPFSSCCRVASMGSKCDRCGEEITYHQDSAAVARAKQLHREGKCGMCGSPRGNPAVSGNCHC